MRAAYPKSGDPRRLVVALVLSSLVVAQGAAQDLTAPLPLDPAVHAGTLPNGLRYFIRQNGRPEKRISLRLAVQAGSIDEQDDQLGLAHFLEHMAFNGTTHFKPGELVSYLESIGARFGADANAYTSYDETVYTLDVPTDKPDLVRRGFEAIGDFAGGLTLDPREIERERGVIIEEWRQRQGAGSRIQTAQSGALFGTSKYANRVPIGSTDVLKSFPADRLRDFYREHYRPERMAVVVVGDLDRAAVEELIRENFSGLRRGAGGQRPLHEVPEHPDTRYTIVADKEAQASSVTVVHRHPAQALRTVGDYRRTLTQSLAAQMLNERLGEIARRPDAPFLGASAGRTTLGRATEAFTLGARVNDGGIPQGLRAIEQEIARVRQHGFGAAELDRAKKSMLAGYERAFNEREKSESGRFATELVNYFLEGEAAPGIQAEYDLAHKFIPLVTAEQAAAELVRLMPERNRVVLAVTPSKEGVPVVTEAALAGSMREASGPVAAWRDEAVGQELMPKPPQPGAVRASRQIPELGVTVLSLSNGVEVWLKPTQFKNDQVFFTAYAKGGTSLADEAGYRDAALSSALVGVAGIGGLSPVDLGKVLAGKIASVSTYMGGYTHGINGSSTPRDLETALQLLYLQFTSPNHDAQAFDLLKRRLKAQVANQDQNPGAAFAERLRTINTKGHYSVQPLRAEDIDRLSSERMLAYYAARFGNAADFTFFMVGAFTVDEITPLLTTYIGSLPSTGAPTSRVGDVNLEFPAGTTRETVTRGQEPRSQTVISFFADTGLDEMEMHRARAAAAVLQMHLRELLREELGGTYSVAVGYSNTQPKTGYGTTSVQFGSAPDTASNLMSAVLTEVERLRRDGPTAEDVQKVQETERRDLETSLRENGYWLSSLETLHLLGWDPLRILKRAERTEMLTRENIQDAFRKYFPTDRWGN
jgi:zinc protease